MLNYNQSYFRLERAHYIKSKNLLRLLFFCHDAYTPQIPAHERSVTKQVLDFLQEDIEIEFDYQTAAVPRTDVKTSREAMEKLKAYSDSLPAIEKVDKTMVVREVEYWCGVPIKIRPVQIKYLKVSKDLQVTAGTMHFVKLREYKRTVEGAEVKKNYWTFMLDDGDTRLQCVHFPTEKTRSKFEALKDRTQVCLIGIHDRNNRGELSFRVSGVSFCEF